MVRNSAITCDERAARRQAHRHRVCSRGARAWHALDGRGGGTLVNLVDGARNQVPSVQRVRVCGGRYKTPCVGAYALYMTGVCLMRHLGDFSPFISLLRTRQITIVR